MYDNIGGQDGLLPDKGFRSLLDCWKNPDTFYLIYYECFDISIIYS